MDFGCLEMATDTIKFIQSHLASKNFAFLPAADMCALMGNYYKYSSTDEEEFRQFWDSAIPQTDENEEEVYPYKSTLVSYFQMDVKKDFNSIHRSKSHNSEKRRRSRRRKLPEEQIRTMKDC